MLLERQKHTTLSALGVFLALLHHTIVRNTRSAAGNAAVGVLAVIFKIVVLVIVFYLLFGLLGARGSAVHGDFLLYILTGIFLFIFQNSTMAAVIGASDPIGPMMQHSRMTPMLNVLGAAIAQLYVHIVALIPILFFIHYKNHGLDLYDPAGMAFVFVLTWALGISTGLVLAILRPLFPRLMQIISSVYQRTNMFTSGKFFLANSLPYTLLIFMSWNPLFHTIDQMRGYTFVNYFPHKSSLDYPMTFFCVSMVIGLMGQFWLSRNLSLSTTATK